MNLIAPLLWLDEYHREDLGRQLPLQISDCAVSGGYVIPSELIQRLFLTPALCDKIAAIREAHILPDSFDIDSGKMQIDALIRHTKIDRATYHLITRAYESLLDHEHTRLYGAPTHMHRAKHILSYVYHPPTVSVSSLPVPNIRYYASGGSSLCATIRQLAADHILQTLHQRTSPHLPSVLIQRTLASEYVGTVTPHDSSGNHEYLVTAHTGALPLDADPDVYTVDAALLQITSKQMVTQPYKMILRRSVFTKVDLSPSLGELQKLSDEHIIQVALVAHRLHAQHYFPQRISWAFEQGKLYITDMKKSSL